VPAPSQLPGVIGGPPAYPGRLPVAVAQGGSGGRTGPFTVRQIVGVNIAFGSPALTDEPLWIRIDDPGSNV
jgi:alkanesulfonate monooxygenase SsuD/methylene tetrahydromethanopterin reductase-like flavin-dependent oxidoreductase (luciferase family)